MFVGAVRGEGVSTVSREFARLAAVRASKPVWLIDADFTRQDQQHHLAQHPERFGRAGTRVTGSPDGSAFYTVRPPLMGADGEAVRPAKLLTAKPFLGRRLYSTRLELEALVAGQSPVVVPQADYWIALSQHADVVVVDVPSVDREDTALRLAPFMDDIVMVIGESASVTAPKAAKEQLQAAGGRVSGIVINKATYRAPRALEKMLG